MFRISSKKWDQVSSVEFKGDGYTLEGTLQDGSQFKTTRPVYVQDNQLMDDLFLYNG